jgi:hypothetical protein
MSKPRLYRISFTNQGQVYEIYARSVSHGFEPNAAGYVRTGAS